MQRSVGQKTHQQQIGSHEGAWIHGAVRDSVLVHLGGEHFLADSFQATQTSLKK